jgi:integrase
VDTNYRLAKRIRLNFKSEEEAIIEAQKIHDQYHNHGQRGLLLIDEKRQEIMSAFQLMARDGISNVPLPEIVSFYLSHKKPFGGDKTCRELFDSLMTEKRRKQLNLSRVYLRSLGEILEPFLRDYEARYVSTLTSQELRDWIESRTINGTGKPLANVTKSNLYRHLSLLFRWGISQGHLPASPLRFKNEWRGESKPEILTIPQCEALLYHAYADFKKTGMPWIFVYTIFGLFCGIRREELLRLKLGAIIRDTITIEPEESKTKSLRTIPIPLNAQLMFATTELDELDGSYNIVDSLNFRRSFERVRSNAGIIKWPKNALRHSFASYFYATTRNAEELMNRLGHNVSSTTFGHYLKPIREENPLRFFELTCDNEFDEQIEVIKRSIKRSDPDRARKKLISEYNLG